MVRVNPASLIERERKSLDPGYRFAIPG